MAIGNKAIGDLTAGLQRGGIDADLKDKILIKFSKVNYIANTAGAGLAKNSIQTKICNFRICG